MHYEIYALFVHITIYFTRGLSNFKLPYQQYIYIEYENIPVCSDNIYDEW